DLYLEAVPGEGTAVSPVRVLEDREITRWKAAQGSGGALIIWESGMSKPTRFVSCSTIQSPGEASDPQRLDFPFPSFVVPFEHHAVMLASENGTLLSKRVDLGV